MAYQLLCHTKINPRLSVKKISTFLIGCLVVLNALCVSAETMTFEDENLFYWPEFSNSLDYTHNGLTPDNSDYWGVPDILRGAFEFTDHALTSISLEFIYKEYGVLPRCAWRLVF